MFFLHVDICKQNSECPNRSWFVAIGCRKKASKNLRFYLSIPFLFLVSLFLSFICPCALLSSVVFLSHLHYNFHFMQRTYTLTSLYNRYENNFLWISHSRSCSHSHTFLGLVFVFSVFALGIPCFFPCPYTFDSFSYSDLMRLTYTSFKEIRLNNPKCIFPNLLLFVALHWRGKALNDRLFDCPPHCCCLYLHSYCLSACTFCHLLSWSCPICIILFYLRNKITLHCHWHGK